MDAAPFYLAIEKALGRRGLKLREGCPPADPVARRALEEYGAIYLACEEVAVPPCVIFSDEAEVEAFQRHAGWQTEMFGDVPVTLQPAAMEALLSARAALHEEGLEITPRGGIEASRRTYADTARLWRSRVARALQHWVSEGRLTPEEAARIEALALHEQVACVLECEARGLFFSKCFTKPITRSVALPGASQHLAMLAFDLAEFQNQRVRDTLMQHGWFQTVLEDLPHFTFLGRTVEELPTLGLTPTAIAGQTFWTPNLKDFDVGD
ncbi:hypothetical protein [Pyrinomonas sp.]|uniref:hypothetical protein n=1 Tax=Pyrinomonas sp. TaxID=2080306 RepID=UPI0033226793